ncbi:NUDIX domain-containing protein [Microbacterium proteolyticum]|uniref:NUDIX domain-containing protein n=1 Tax=Microbacterium proteolyticum TaxID=1572644 RepID=UPI001FADE6C4|nr:NUDIX domain-containing protein [Microbacterium proteolyticum]MCI9859313.1 NUDIX domain-containing protein [Microbacterium proteolyticum]
MTPSAPLPGTTVPDHRGRSGLHLTGRDLDRNPRVIVDDVELLAAGWHVLRATTYRYRGDDGEWVTQKRETYDRGNGATVLLYDPTRRTVLLTRQFRYPVYVNDHPNGMLIETAAGLLDDDDPVTAIRREAEEETGVRVDDVQHVFDVYMSPGSVTERLHFFAAAYDGSTRRGDRGGLVEEGEEIEIIEHHIDDALTMIRNGSIQDAKTIMLLQWAVLEGPFARG